MNIYFAVSKTSSQPWTFRLSKVEAIYTCLLVLSQFKLCLDSQQWTNCLGMMQMINLSYRYDFCIMFYDLWLVSYDLWLISYVLWLVFYDLWLMSYDLWLISYDLWLMFYDLWLMSYDLWLMSYDLWLM